MGARDYGKAVSAGRLTFGPARFSAVGLEAVQLLLRETEATLHPFLKGSDLPGSIDVFL